jgi:hypothetical protein
VAPRRYAYAVTALYLLLTLLALIYLPRGEGRRSRQWGHSFTVHIRVGKNVDAGSTPGDAHRRFPG